MDEGEVKRKDATSEQQSVSDYSLSAVKHGDLEDIYSRLDRLVPEKDLHTFKQAVRHLLELDPQNAKQYNAAMNSVRRKFSINPKYFCHTH